MIRKVVKSLAELGLSPRWLIARQWVAGKLSPAHATGKMENILFSFPYQSVGDVVLVVTLLEQIHALWPSAAIDVLLGETMAELVRAIPYVRSVVVVSRSKPGRPIQVAYDQIRKIQDAWKRGACSILYDLAIAPRWDSLDNLFSAYGAFLSAAPVRCGYLGTYGNPESANPMLTHVARGGTHEHEADRYTRLLGRCGLFPTQSSTSISTCPVHTLIDLAAARAGAAILPVDQPFFLVAPGATSPKRMWPVDAFAETARALQRHYHWVPVVMGGPSDKPLCDELAAKIGDGALSIAGSTSTLQMLDVMAASRLLLGNDSGPAHLSGALDRPTCVISPFPLSSSIDHHNNPKRFHPLGTRTLVFQPATPLEGCVDTCDSTSAHCILQIPASVVLGAVCEHLEREKEPDAISERGR